MPDDFASISSTSIDGCINLRIIGFTVYVCVCLSVEIIAGKTERTKKNV